MKKKEFYKIIEYNFDDRFRSAIYEYTISSDYYQLKDFWNLYFNYCNNDWIAVEKFFKFIFYLPKINKGNEEFLKVFYEVLVEKMLSSNTEFLKSIFWFFMNYLFKILKIIYLNDLNIGVLKKYLMLLICLHVSIKLLNKCYKKYYIL